MDTVADWMKMSADQIYERIGREHVLVDRVHGAKDGLVVCETKADVGGGGRGLSFLAGARRRLVDGGFGRGFGECLQHGAVALLEVFEGLFYIRSMALVVVADCHVPLCIVHHVLKQKKQCRNRHDQHVRHAVACSTRADWREGRERFKRRLRLARRCVCQAGPDVARERAARFFAWLVAAWRAGDEVEEIVDGEEGCGLCGGLVRLVRFVGLCGRGGAADCGGREVQEQVGHFWSGRGEGACMRALHEKNGWKYGYMIYKTALCYVFTSRRMAYVALFNEAIVHVLTTILQEGMRATFQHTRIPRQADTELTGLSVLGYEDGIVITAEMPVAEREAVKIGRTCKKFHHLHNLVYTPARKREIMQTLWEAFADVVVQGVLAMEQPSSCAYILCFAGALERVYIGAEHQEIRAAQSGTGAPVLDANGVLAWPGNQWRLGLRYSEHGRFYVFPHNQSLAGEPDSRIGMVHDWLTARYAEHGLLMDEVVVLAHP